MEFLRDALSRHISIKGAVAATCSAVGILAADPAAQTRWTTAGGMELLVTVVHQYSDSPTTLARVCAAIAVLTGCGSSLPLFWRQYGAQLQRAVLLGRDVTAVVPDHSVVEPQLV